MKKRTVVLQIQSEDLKKTKDNLKIEITSIERRAIAAEEKIEALEEYELLFTTVVVLVSLFLP